MSTLPYFKFYTNDWLVDTATLSPTAKGCYIDILAHTWSKKSFFRDNDTEMARLLRLTKGQWRKVKIELEQYFDLKNGTFFNKRLAKELQESEEKREKNKLNASLGGIAKSLKRKETAIANGKRTLGKGMPILESELELESKEIYKEKCFEEFWNQYPRKVSKKASEKAYLKAIQKFTHQEILNGLMKYTFNPDPKMIPHASTWLNGERWNDEPTDYTTNSNQSSHAAEAYRDFISRREAVS
jgi:uncharacterized protein YdaU (DUF1376 family)